MGNEVESYLIEIGIRRIGECMSWGLKIICIRAVADQSGGVRGGIKISVGIARRGKALDKHEACRSSRPPWAQKSLNGCHATYGSRDSQACGGMKIVGKCAGRIG